MKFTEIFFSLGFWCFLNLVVKRGDSKCIGNGAELTVNMKGENVDGKTAID